MQGTNVPRPRDYTRITDIALGTLGGGLCYWPGCPEPVLRRTGGQMFFIGQRVHIRGAYPGSACFDPAMTDDQRHDFANLVVMYKQAAPRHHRHPAAGSVPAGNPAAVEDQREASPAEALVRLREVTPSGLRKSGR